MSKKPSKKQQINRKYDTMKRKKKQTNMKYDFRKISKDFLYFLRNILKKNLN